MSCVANGFGDTDMGPLQDSDGGNSPADQLKRASQEEARGQAKKRQRLRCQLPQRRSAKPGQANPEQFKRPVQLPLDPLRKQGDARGGWNVPNGDLLPTHLLAEK